MENLNILMTEKRIGAFPSFYPSPLGFFSIVGAGSLGASISMSINPDIVSSSVVSIATIVAAWAANRWYEKSGNNLGWHWLTDPPNDLSWDEVANPILFDELPQEIAADTENEIVIDEEMTRLIQRKTGNHDLLVEVTRSAQYKILLIQNDDPTQLNTESIKAGIAIKEGIESEDAVKFARVFKRGYSAFIIPLPKSDWLPVPFDESLIEKEAPTVQLGTDLKGENVSIDLEINPHTIVTGKTGSGKTAWMRVYIESLIKSVDPILYIIDPNDNLSKYADTCKRSGGDYFIDIEAGARQLSELTTEPNDENINSLHPHNFAMRKREMSGFNNYWEYKKQRPESRPVVFIVDELAAITTAKDKDLRSTFIADISTVARRFRAAGALLLLATQRPSVDILPGELKANCGNVIALSQPNRASSQVAIDSNDAVGLPDLGGFAARIGGRSGVVFGRTAFVD